MRATHGRLRSGPVGADSGLAVRSGLFLTRRCPWLLIARRRRRGRPCRLWLACPVLLGLLSLLGLAGLRLDSCAFSLSLPLLTPPAEPKKVVVVHSSPL